MDMISILLHLACYAFRGLSCNHTCLSHANFLPCVHTSFSPPTQSSPDPSHTQSCC